LTFQVPVPLVRDAGQVITINIKADGAPDIRELYVSFFPFEGGSLNYSSGQTIHWDFGPAFPTSIDTQLEVEVSSSWLSYDEGTFQIGYVTIQDQIYDYNRYYFAEGAPVTCAMDPGGSANAGPGRVFGTNRGTCLDTHNFTGKTFSVTN
jgi:hypothetical protein